MEGGTLHLRGGGRGWQGENTLLGREVGGGVEEGIPVFPPPHLYQTQAMF